MEVAREVTYRCSPRGAVLYTCSWRPVPPATAPSPRGALLLLSGYNSYTGPNHDWLASLFLPAGIAVYGLDHHGFGRSTDAHTCALPAPSLLSSCARSARRTLCCFGRLGYLPSFPALVSDAVHTALAIAALHPGQPLFLLGESMGGTVALEASLALQAAGQPCHLLLLAPMCSLGRAVAVPPLLQAAGYALSLLAPLLPNPVLKDTAALHCKSPERLRDAAADPLRWQRPMRLATAFALKGAAAAAQGRLAAFAPASMLVLHGSSDAMCPLEGSLALLAASPCQDKALVEYQGALHSLWAEPVATRRLLALDLLAWVAARAGLEAGSLLQGEGLGGAAAELARAPSVRESARGPGRFLHCARPEGAGVFQDASLWTALPYRAEEAAAAAAAQGARGAASVQ